MADNDWDHVTVIRKKPATAAAAKSASAVNAALRSGVGVETSKKFSAGTNRQHTTSKDTAKLDRETEELHHEKVPLSVGKAIAQARAAKTPVMSQKDLATAINEKPQIVNEYESGKAIPNPVLLGKMERVLGVKLRGKDIGSPLNQGPKK